MIAYYSQQEEGMDMNMTQDEAAIRRLIEDWASAVRAQKVDKIVDRHANDIVMFDVPPPVEVRGIAAYRETWPPFLEWLREGDGTFEIMKLEVAAGDRVAYATALLRCASKAALAKDNTPRLRLTVGLRKIDGAWNIAHEHHSFPADV